MLQSASGVDSLLTSPLARFLLAPEIGVLVSEYRLPVDFAKLYTELEADGEAGGLKIPAFSAWPEVVGTSK